MCYAFSPVEDQAFGYLEQEALHLFEGKEKGKDFEIEKDAIGNLFITWYGNNRDRMVMSGSHVDSVFRGGNYDGVAGVNSAFNFLRTLVEQEDKPENSYMVAVFRGEESSPKQEQPVSGSRIATGTITPVELEKITYNMDDGSSMLLKDYLGQEKWRAILEEITILNKKGTCYRLRRAAYRAK